MGVVDYSVRNTSSRHVFTIGPVSLPFDSKQKCEALILLFDSSSNRVMQKEGESKNSLYVEYNRNNSTRMFDGPVGLLISPKFISSHFLRVSLDEDHLPEVSLRIALGVSSRLIFLREVQYVLRIHRNTQTQKNGVKRPTCAPARAPIKHKEL